MSATEPTVVAPVEGNEINATAETTPAVVTPAVDSKADEPAAVVS